MRRPPSLRLYLLAARLAGPLARAILARRAKRGKEDPARLGERLGVPGLARPDGPLVWLHCASVGESVAILGLIAALAAERPDLRFLVTTGTVASARLLADRLPEGALHQYAPVDVQGAVTGFLTHWRPDLCLWVESEIWPCLIDRAGDSGAAMALINTRMSEKSAASWARSLPMIRALLGRFRVIAAQDRATRDRLLRLGADPARMRVTGTLKSGHAPPDAPEVRRALAGALRGRAVWLAASTHPGEEDLAAQAQALLAAETDLAPLLIIAPRHAERGPEIAQTLRARGFQVDLRSETPTPSAACQIYVADTMGEMGVWYRLAPVALLGGSFGALGGHNPYEPALLDCAILHGPDVANFADAYGALTAAGAARAVGDGAEVALAVADLLEDEAARARLTAVAAPALDDQGGALDRVLGLLRPLLPEAGR